MARRYRLADWTAEAGPEGDWLARWAESGRTRNTPTGGWCVVNDPQSSACR